jgi:hypothetical protein
MLAAFLKFTEKPFPPRQIEKREKKNTRRGKKISLSISLFDFSIAGTDSCV